MHPTRSYAATLSPPTNRIIANNAVLRATSSDTDYAMASKLAQPHKTDPLTDPPAEAGQTAPNTTNTSAHPFDASGRTLVEKVVNQKPRQLIQRVKIGSDGCPHHIH